MGAILYQKEGIIAYFTRSFTSTQMKYTATEKECFAIKGVPEKWKTWLDGSKIIVFTDNKNLISHTNNFNRKVERWKTKIGQFKIEYKFVEGKSNGVADELSRKLNNLEIKNKQKPEKSIIQKIAYFHIFNGHSGQFSTINTLRGTGALRRRDTAIIKKYIRECMFCQLNKPGSSIKKSLLTGHIATETPLKSISSDVYGPFDSTRFTSDFEDEKIYCCTITDRTSRICKIKFTEKATSE